MAEHGGVQTGEALGRIPRWPSAEARAWTEQFLLRAESQRGIDAVVAVGSAVAEDVSSHDLDLVVLSRGVDRFESGAPIEVDVRAYATAQAESLLARGSELLGTAVLRGVCLYERRGCWTRLSARWRQRLPWPSAAAAEARALRALEQANELLRIGDLDAARELATANLTQLARAALLRHRVHPASRPELPGQLRPIGGHDLAAALSALLEVADDDPGWITAWRAVHQPPEPMPDVAR